MKKMMMILMVFVFIFSLLVSGCQKTADPTGNAVAEVDEPEEVVKEVAEEPKEEVVEEPEEVAEEPEEEKEVVEDNTHVIKMDNSGFDPHTLKIKTGDTVTWENVRTGKIDIAMLLGTRDCVRIKSGLLQSGESYTHTFEKARTCTFVDGVMIHEDSKVIVE